MLRREVGSRLGLVVSSRLVRLLGGELRCESGSGDGRACYFLVGMPEAELVDPPVPELDGETPSAGPRPLRVLLAEDNLVSQKHAWTILSRGGHLVRVAGSGAEAVRLANSELFFGAAGAVEVGEPEA